MSFTGHILDGQVVLDAPAALPNGTPVRVEPAANGAATEPPIVNPRTGRPYPSYIPRELAERFRRQDSGEIVEEIPSIYDRMKPFIEAAGDLGLPTDGAQNVDHYLYGHPKKK